MPSWGWCLLAASYPGVLADWMGAPNTIMAGGIACILGSFFCEAPALRKIGPAHLCEKGNLRGTRRDAMAMKAFSG